MERKEPSEGECKKGVAEERSVRVIVDKESLWSAGSEEGQRRELLEELLCIFLRESFDGSLPCKEALSWSMRFDRNSRS